MRDSSRSWVSLQDGTKDCSPTLKDRGDGEGAGTHFDWELDWNVGSGERSNGKEAGDPDNLQRAQEKPGLPAARAPIRSSFYLALRFIFEIVLLQSEPGCIVLEFLNFTVVIQGR